MPSGLLDVNCWQGKSRRCKKIGNVLGTRNRIRIKQSDPDPYQLKSRIRIRISIKVTNRIQIRIKRVWVRNTAYFNELCTIYLLHWTVYYCSLQIPPVFLFMLSPLIPELNHSKCLPEFPKVLFKSTLHCGLCMESLLF
jgi:hypothetical protein